jgi:hypothetical protein
MGKQAQDFIPIATACQSKGRNYVASELYFSETAIAVEQNSDCKGR